MFRTPLHPAHVATMQAQGTVVDYGPGDVLQHLGAAVARF